MSFSFSLQDVLLTIILCCRVLACQAFRDNTLYYCQTVLIGVERIPYCLNLPLCFALGRSSSSVWLFASQNSIFSQHEHLSFHCGVGERCFSTNSGQWIFRSYNLNCKCTTSTSKFCNNLVFCGRCTRCQFESKCSGQQLVRQCGISTTCVYCRSGF